MKQRARAMSKMQPLKDGVAILTDTQGKDVLEGGFIRSAEFLKGVLNRIFEKDIIDINNPESLENAKNP